MAASGSTRKEPVVEAMGGGESPGPSSRPELTLGPQIKDDDKGVSYFIRVEAMEEGDGQNVRFEARDYQTALVQRAMKHNTVICLPTGSGKTFIALQLIKAFGTQLGDKGKDQKKIVFLAVTVPLVHQQSKYIQENSHMKVGCYTGDMQVDLWDIKKWEQEVHQHEVLALTPEIFVQMLQHGYIQWSEIVLLIVDECHHAVGDHPMKLAMKDFKDAFERGVTVPKVLGLTATLLNSNVKVHNVALEVKILERTMCSQAVTYDYMVVERYATNPKEVIEVYDKNEAVNRAHEQIILEELEKGFAWFRNLEEAYMKNIKSLPCDGTLLTPVKKRPLKKLASALTVVQSVVNDLGLYCANIAALSSIVTIEKNILKSTEDNEINVYRMVQTILVRMRKEIDDIFEQYTPLEQINNFSSPKVLKVLEILSRYKNRGGTSAETEPKPNKIQRVDLKDVDESLCGVIFVKERLTAQILYYYLKDVSKHFPDFSFIMPQYVVGANQGNPNESLISYFNTKRQQEAVKKFRIHEANIMVATSVLEEGIDIPKCNLVLRFDAPMTFTAYVQSMGRARKQGGHYILLASVDQNNDIEGRMEQYHTVQESLRQVVSERSNGLFIDCSSPMEEEDDILPPFQPSNKEGAPKITMTSAISLVHRYCNLLPQDKFSRLAPVCWYVEKMKGEKKLFKAYLRLPINSQVKEDIAGKLMPNVVLAKRAVYLRACEMLYDVGELDEKHLLPVGSHGDKEVDDWVEPKEESKPGHPKPGTRKRRQFYKKSIPKFYIMSWPTEDNYLFLHQFKMVSVGPWDTFPLKPEETDQGFGLLCSKPLPKICKFPLFSKYGALWVSVEVMYKLPSLSLDQLETVGEFHRYFFEMLLGLQHDMLVFDLNDPANEAGLVVPLHRNEINILEINWDLIYEIPVFNEHINQKVNSAHAGEHMPENINLNALNDGLLVPWYRGMPLKFYSVVQICPDLTPLSEFPEGELYDTYDEYYHDKYKIQLADKNQPMVEARLLGMDSSFPLFHLVYRHNKETLMGPKHKEERKLARRSAFKEHLVPELCCVHPMKASLLIQALHIPSALFRYKQILVAEELRIRLAHEANLGQELAEKPDWKPLAYGPDFVRNESVDEIDHMVLNSWDISGVDEMETDKEACNFNESSSKAPRELDTSLHSIDDDSDDEQDENCDEYRMQTTMNGDVYVKEGSEVIDLDAVVDPDDILDRVTHEDIWRYHNAVSSCPSVGSTPPSLKHTIIPKVSRNSNVPDYDHQIKSPNGTGIEPTLLLQALTLAGSNDGYDLERLETVGDSFLKYAVTVHLFCQYPENDEGRLTTHRMRLIKNKFLYILGRMKGLGEMINSIPLEPRSFWAPPGFQVPVGLEEAMVEYDVCYSLLSDYSAMEVLDFSAKQMRELVKLLIDDAQENTPQKDISGVSATTRFFFHHSLSDKSVADCVEAMIGAHLLCYGPEGALRFLSWLGMRDNGIEGREVHAHRAPKTAFIKERLLKSDPSLKTMMCGMDQLEETIGYRFKDPSFLLQAFTHASYFQNKLTDCYQRLEFLGDALLDYLITRHIFEDGKEHSPGQLTDLRSALVNNITFASIAVRYGFHKYLLHSSSSLQKIVDSFVAFQCENNHKVTGHFELLVEEEDVAGEVEVPKVLGDLFESLAGAIYLDSGMSLSVVWQIYYGMMKNEIEIFTADVPKSPMRDLYERFNDKLEIKKVTDEELRKRCKEMVQLTVVVGGKKHDYFGVGRSKQLATTAAAKCALRKLPKKK